MAVMDLMEHLHLHLMVHIPQHTMVVMEKPTNHSLMNLTFHLHPYMVVMAKTTHNLHHMHPPHMEDIANLPHHKLMVHLHPHMVIMAKLTHHLHLMNFMVHLNPHMAVMAKTTHHLHLTNPMVHLNPHMAIMTKTAQHLFHTVNPLRSKIQRIEKDVFPDGIPPKKDQN